MKIILITCASIVLIIGLAGCAQLSAVRDGLGDGKVGGLVDVKTAAAALDLARPGAGDALRQASSLAAAATGKQPTGPFGGLPYTTQRQVVLKTGQVITEAEIERIVEILTPIVPAAIVRVVLPENYATAPIPSSEAPPPASPTPQPAAPTGPAGGASDTIVTDPEVEALVNQED